MAFTFFFRDQHTLELIAEHVVPFVYGRQKIRVWDAGCASGQEAYSLSILLAEKMGKFSFKNLRVHATDIDNSSLFADIIHQGFYPTEQVRRIPSPWVEKYFEPANQQPGCRRVCDLIRSRIQYQRHDLLSLQPVADDFSLILCKNVLLHLLPAERVEVIRMFHRVLAPGGFFAMEQTQSLPFETAPLFEKVTPDAQLFRRI